MCGSVYNTKNIYIFKERSIHLSS